MTFKSGDEKKRGNQKRKADVISDSCNYETKFREAIKVDGSLKSIMLMISADEKSNQALMQALCASKRQPNASSLTLMSTPHSVTDASSSDVVNQPTATIDTLAQAYPVTTVKLNAIVRK